MRRPLTVKELNNYIKRSMTTDPILNNVYIVGEVTNFQKNKFLFFDLKEDQDLISCVYFSDAIDIKAGDQVRLKGTVTIYPRSSKYQIIVKSIDNIGLGIQALELEKLKNKLEKKGYFDQANKKKIPDFPIKIGLVTSDKSAAYTDFLSILTASYPLATISLYSSFVQGDQAKDDICRGLEELDMMGLDLIVLTRGGGSNEDLGVFLEEDIADTIFKLKTPIISALGHERDLSLADLVSDLRLSTPTKAAEYIARNFSHSLVDIESINSESERFIRRIIDQKVRDLRLLNLEIENNSPGKSVYKDLSKLSEINHKIQLTINRQIQDEENRLDHLREEINRNFSKIQERYMIKLLDLSARQISLKNVVVGGEYFITNDFNKYRIEVLEQIDD